MTSTRPDTGALPATEAEADLVVLSHLRWDWVWQRPQHLISRLAAHRRTWFVEEPQYADVPAPRLRRVDVGPVRRMWLEIPPDDDGCEFAKPAARGYADLLRTEIHASTGGAPVDAWIYTPTALPLAEALRPRLLVYDVMDDLAAFADGGDDLRRRQIDGLNRADLVFTGGRSLHRSAAAVRGPERTHLFPSGVELSHYARSRDLRGPHSRPVAGYVGVLDERLDLPLIAEMAAQLTDWDIHLVGPTAKIDPADLPQAPNLYYPGMQPYELLPYVMAQFDVALMPFALNDATRSISPTKTLEYLAAGLPVVSTRVPDVVSDWGEVVHLADDGRQFARACRVARVDSLEARDRRVAPLRARHEWDVIADDMRRLMSLAVAERAGARSALRATAPRTTVRPSTRAIA